jgi:hypothetical protein
MKKKIFNYGIGILLAASLFINITAFIEDNPAAKAPGDICGDPCKTLYEGLPISTVKAMINEYGQKQYADINNAALGRIRFILGANTAGTQAPSYSYTDARNVYFDLDTIRQFICTIIEKVKEKDLRKTDGTLIESCDLGIKIYYAAYKNVTLVKAKIKQGLLDSYAGKHTVVLVATYRDSDKKIKAFDPKQFNRDAIARINRPMPMSQILQNNWSGSLTALTVSMVSAESGIIARNHGTLCPPPGNCEDDLTK